MVSKDRLLEFRLRKTSWLHLVTFVFYLMNISTSGRSRRIYKLRLVLTYLCPKHTPKKKKGRAFGNIGNIYFPDREISLAFFFFFRLFVLQIFC